MTSVRGREEMCNLFIMAGQLWVRRASRFSSWSLSVSLSRSLCSSVVEEEGVPRETAGLNLGLNHMASVCEFWHGKFLHLTVSYFFIKNCKIYKNIKFINSVHSHCGMNMMTIHLQNLLSSQTETLYPLNTHSPFSPCPSPGNCHSLYVTCLRVWPPVCRVHSNHTVSVPLRWTFFT